MKSLLIADDHGLYRQGVATLVSDRFGVERVIHAATLDDTLKALSSEADIDCLLIDLNMPGMQGVASLARIKEGIKERHEDARIVVISASDQRDDVLGALAQGAHGYVWKGLDTDEIASALGAVMSGAIYVPSRLVAREWMEVASESARSGRASPADEQRDDEGVAIDLSRFTPRQAQVMALLTRGMSNQDIAGELDLSVSTVKTHVAAILRGVGAHNRKQAVLLAQTPTPRRKRSSEQR